MKVYTLNTVNSNKITLTFEKPVNNILIKNFSGDDITFSFDDVNYACIPDGGYQSIYTDTQYINKIYIKPKVTSTGGVELCII